MAESAGAGRDTCRSARLRVMVPTAVVLLCAWIANLALAPHITADDGCIYVRYAMNWVDHGELAWNVGARGTDGFTSIAFQVLSALAYLIHRSDPVSAVCSAGLLAATATVVISVVFPVVRAGRDRLAVAGGMAFLCAIATSALVPQFAYWSTALLDAPLVALSVLLASVGAPALFGRALTPSRAVLAGLALALLFTTRPEGHAGRARRRVSRARQCRAGPRSRRLVPCPVSRRRRSRLRSTGLLVSCVASAAIRARVSESGLREGPCRLLLGRSRGWLPLLDGRARPWRHTERMIRHGAGGLAVHVPGRAVHNAISPIGTSWPARLFIVAIPLLWLSTWWKSLFRAPELAAELRIALLVPLGMATLVLLAGGDPLFNGWRVLIPLLPAVGVTISRAAEALRHRASVLALLVLVGSAAASLGLAMVSRPAMCATAAQACGVEALRRLPTSSVDAAWDTTSAIEDRECAAAIVDAFPPTIVVGQSDYLRVSRWIPGPVLDLSGLVNADLAHADHEPATSLFSISALLASGPDIHFYGWTFVSTNSLAASRLDQAGARAAFRPFYGRVPSPWPPPDASPGDLHALAELYAGASVRLSSGLFCNFLVRRGVVGKMRPSARISIGP